MYITDAQNGFMKDLKCESYRINFIKFFFISFKMFAISEQEQAPAIVQSQNAYSLRILTIGVDLIFFKREANILYVLVNIIGLCKSFKRRASCAIAALVI